MSHTLKYLVIKQNAPRPTTSPLIGVTATTEYHRDREQSRSYVVVDWIGDGIEWKIHQYRTCIYSGR